MDDSIFQAQITAKWADPAETIRKMKKDEWSELKDEFLNSFQPDRTLMSLQLFGEMVGLSEYFIQNKSWIS